MRPSLYSTGAASQDINDIARNRKVWLRSIDTAIREIEKTGHIDIVNVHCDDYYVFDLLTRGTKRWNIIYSLHNPYTENKKDIIELVNKNDINCVVLSSSHKEDYSMINRLRVIPFGVDVFSSPYSLFPLSRVNVTPRLFILRMLKERNKDYLVTVGRISENKGIHSCIKLALETNYSLIIAGPPRNRDEYLYFERYVAPYVDGKKIIYFGTCNEIDKEELLMYSVGFLNFSGFENKRWKEPYGRAWIEGMACGTPAICHNWASMSEQIEDGINGYLFSTFQEAKEKVQSIERIDRLSCRSFASGHFDFRHHASEMEAFFLEVGKA
uniref:Glycosyltransferase involved in cell wall bisynthesis n=1 Tax=Candidatus Kentrum sp. DK TaxID=2126562 RepID=A0A450S8H7_9GAMM|nr:MAG: Glycosyltransferase involved in cell wall bisynthesis [Candidatus Kentron sp. DK]